MRKSYGKEGTKSLKNRTRRKLAIRKKIAGTVERPRVSVIRSNKNLSAQVIDDSCGKTLLSAQTYGKNKVAAGNNKETAKALGANLAEQLKAKKIESCVFDRNGRIYTGVVAAIAEGMRENGIRV